MKYTKNKSKIFLILMLLVLTTSSIFAILPNTLAQDPGSKTTYAIIGGQLSRYLFTSSVVALYISTIVSTGIPSPLGGDIIAKFNSYAGKVGANPSYNSFLSNVAIVWLARFPSMTLSILVNAFLSVFVIRTVGVQLREFIRYFTRDTEKNHEKKD